MSWEGPGAVCGAIGLSLHGFLCCACFPQTVWNMYLLQYLPVCSPPELEVGCCPKNNAPIIKFYMIPPTTISCGVSSNCHNCYCIPLLGVSLGESGGCHPLPGFWRPPPSMHQLYDSGKTPGPSVGQDMYMGSIPPPATCRPYR